MVRNVDGERLHELVEMLSRVVEMAVELTDVALQPVARSAYYTDDGEPDTWFTSTPRLRGGLRSTSSTLARPLTIPAVPELGLPAAHVVPLTTAGATSHYLWLMSPHGEPSAELAAYARRVAQATLDAVGYRIAAEQAAPDAADLLPALVTGSDQVRQNVLEDLVGEHRFAHDDCVFSLAASLHMSDRPPDAVEVEDVLRRVARRVCGRYPKQRSVVACHDFTLVLGFAPYRDEDATSRADELAVVLRDSLYRAFRNTAGIRWLVGVSDPAAPFTSAAEAVRQALEVVRVGTRLGWSGRTATWGRLGQLRILAAIPEDVLETSLIPPRLRRFLGDRANTDLVDTLVSFLDNNGSVRSIAAELYLHRASVYHRLKRIQQELDIDLSDSTSRLETHMAVTAWRLLHTSHR